MLAGLAPNKEGVGVGIAGARAGIEAGVAPKPNPEEEEEGALAGVNVGVGVGVGVAPNEKPPVEGEGAAAADAVGVPKLKAIGFIYIYWDCMAVSQLGCEVRCIAVVLRFHNCLLGCVSFDGLPEAQNRGYNIILYIQGQYQPPMLHFTRHKLEP
jgi:hypothetical protein